MIRTEKCAEDPARVKSQTLRGKEPDKMKRHLVTLLMAVAICQAGNAQDIGTNDINHATLLELGRIRVALERIADNLGQLTTNETQRRAFSKAYFSDDAFQARGPDL